MGPFYVNATESMVKRSLSLAVTFCPLDEEVPVPGAFRPRIWRHSRLGWLEVRGVGQHGVSEACEAKRSAAVAFGRVKHLVGSGDGFPGVMIERSAANADTHRHLDIRGE